MNSRELQFNATDRLFVGFCGVPLELVAALNLCRRFDGVVLFREKDIMVVEFNADPEIIDLLLTKLPRGAVTHLWRSGPPHRQAASAPFTPFLRSCEAQNVQNASVCAAAGSDPAADSFLP